MFTFLPNPTVVASFGSYDLMIEPYILTGQWRIFGDFDLCNKIRADQYDPTYRAPYDVKYCLQNMVSVIVPLNRCKVF